MVGIIIKIREISENSLFKILILEIKEESYFFSDVFKELSYIWFTRPKF